MYHVGRFREEDLNYRPPEESSTVGQIMEHQLLSERRFFGVFLGTPEHVLPLEKTVGSYAARLVELAFPRLSFFAAQEMAWWTKRTQFFEAERERIWIFWRRVLHTSHRRTQLTVYLRLLNRAIPSTYGPTADVSWGGADPTTTIEAAGRN
jgi:uncharacterized damage-inducible protein DinB